MSNLKSENPFGFFELIDELEDVEDRLQMYNEAKTMFTKLYAESKWEPAQNLIAQILDLISCKIKENIIKYNSLKVPF